MNYRKSGESNSHLPEPFIHPIGCDINGISQVFSGYGKYRYLGGICSFWVRKYFSFPDDICNYSQLSLNSRNPQFDKIMDFEV